MHFCWIFAYNKLILLQNLLRQHSRWVRPESRKSSSPFFHCHFSTLNSLAAGDTIESDKIMFSPLTKVLQETLTSMDTQQREHSKYQMESVNKLTEAVTQLNSLYNANKLAARSTADHSLPLQWNRRGSFLSISSADLIIFSVNNR